MLKTYTLKNGLRVATYSIPQMRSIYISEVVKGGSMFDTPQNCGVAHFMEHMLVQGVPSFPNVEVFSSFLEGLAANFGASTSPVDIKFDLSAPTSHLEDALKITHEVFFKPLFPEEAVEKERQAVFEEIKQRQDSTQFKIGKFFYQIRYKKEYPFLFHGGGTIDTVAKLSRQEMIDFWSKLFFPTNTYLVVVGAFDSGSIRKIINQIFGKDNSKQRFPGFPNITNKDLSEKSVAIRTDQGLQTCYLDLSWPTVPFDGSRQDRATQTVLGNILTGLRVSRLFQLLRYRKGLVYNVNYSVGGNRSHSYFNIYSEVSTEKLDEVVRLIAQELRSFYQDGPTDQEMEFAKNYRINRILMSFDHPGAIANWIEDELIWYDEITLPEEYLKRWVRGITTSMMVDFMKKYWDFGKLNLTIQGSIKNSQANVRKFKALVADLK